MKHLSQIAIAFNSSPAPAFMNNIHPHQAYNTNPQPSYTIYYNNSRPFHHGHSDNSINHDFMQRLAREVSRQLKQSKQDWPLESD